MNKKTNTEVLENFQQRLYYIVTVKQQWAEVSINEQCTIRVLCNIAALEEK